MYVYGCFLPNAHNNIIPPQFVEVKGPGDRLSHKHIIWFSRLANWSCDIDWWLQRGESCNSIVGCSIVTRDHIHLVIVEE